MIVRLIKAVVVSMLGSVVIRTCIWVTNGVYITESVVLLEDLSYFWKIFHPLGSLISRIQQ